MLFRFITKKLLPDILLVYAPLMGGYLKKNWNLKKYILNFRHIWLAQKDKIFKSVMYGSLEIFFCKASNFLTQKIKVWHFKNELWSLLKPTIVFHSNAFYLSSVVPSLNLCVSTSLWICLSLVNSLVVLANSTSFKRFAYSYCLIRAPQFVRQTVVLSKISSSLLYLKCVLGSRCLTTN